MSVLVGYNTRLVVQGMSGSAGAFHARQMVEYGTRVVAGVTPGKGGASPEKIANAFRIVLTDPNVRAILVNIFAGINRCDWIAQGVIVAVKEVGLQVPLVVRLEGTNVELGKKMLAESKLNIVAAADMADGAQKVVKAAKEAK